MAKKDKEKAASREDLRLEVLFIIALLALMATFFIMSIGYPTAARVMPYVFMIPLTIILISQLIRVLNLYRSLPAPDDQISEMDSLIKQLSKKKSVKGYFLVLWMIVFLILINLVGIVFGIGIFLICFLRFISEEPWRVALLIGIIVPAVIHILFQVLFGIILYPGLIGRFL